MRNRGILIVFEGVDGSGKSTHINFLSKELSNLRHQIVLTSEPSKGRTGKFIRRYSKTSKKRLPPTTEALLFAADRFDHIERVIEPALKKGFIVITDRFLHSSLAYQGAAGVSLEWIRKINEFTPKPDLAILLDIHPKDSLQRVKRPPTVFEQSDYLEKVRDIYIELVQKGELVYVDADRTKKEVQEDILKITNGLLKKFNLLK